MKKSALTNALLSIVGGILIGLSYSEGMPAIVCFIAFVPMLIAAKNDYITSTALFAGITSVLSLLIQYLFTPASLNILSISVQFLMFALPWVFYQLIRLRHNEKLGYLALVSSWVFLEWVAAQYFEKWIGLQLGHALMNFPFLIQWYDFLGVSAGTIWILVINIHISRIILPAQPFTRKHAILNGIIVLLVPVIFSICYIENLENSSMSFKINEINNKLFFISERNESLTANEKKKTGFFYKSEADTVENALFTNTLGEKIPILAKMIRIGNIGGIKEQYIVTHDLDGQKLGMVNASSLLRADLIRMYALEKCNLLVCFDEVTKVPAAIASSRALENNFDIIVLNKNQSKIFLKTGVQKDLQSNFKLSNQKQGFFSSYGDLIGRLSIFVSIWMLLGTIVKPFRKK